MDGFAMKKIILGLVFIMIALIILGCRQGEKMELNKYVEMSSKDYNDNYSYLADENSALRSLSYDRLFMMIDKKETFVLYVGGYWCPNCQAIMPFANQVAKEQEKLIYNFDTRIGSSKNKEDDIRNCNNKAQKKLYAAFVEKLGFKSDDKTEQTDIARMSVPCLIAIVKGEALSFLMEEYLYNEETKSLYKDGSNTDCTEDYLLKLNELFNKI